jgi:hypothetical protein
MQLQQELPTGVMGTSEQSGGGEMSALGHKRTLGRISLMSALPPKADVLTSAQRLGFGLGEPHEPFNFRFDRGIK